MNRLLQPQQSVTAGIYRMEGRQLVRRGGGGCEVMQHNSLLEHRGNVTGLCLAGASVLVSASRDRSVNIHHFLSTESPKIAERKSYL